MKNALVWVGIVGLAVVIWWGASSSAAGWPWSKAVYRGNAGITLTIPNQVLNADVVVTGHRRADLELTHFVKDWPVFQIGLGDGRETRWIAEPDRDRAAYTVKDAKTGKVIDRLILVK